MKKKNSVGLNTNTSTKSESFYKAFPCELIHQDKDSVKTCWFSDEYDMNKYMERYKVTKKNSKIIIHNQ